MNTLSAVKDLGAEINQNLAVFGLCVPYWVHLTNSDESINALTLNAMRPIIRDYQL
jgi:hypothetical protein